MKSALAPGGMSNVDEDILNFLKAGNDSAAMDFVSWHSEVLKI